MSPPATFESVEQTMVLPVVAAGKKPLAEMARPVALLQGSQPDFSRETNRLLQDRLQWASLLLCLGYSAFLLKSLLLPPAMTAGQEQMHFALFASVTALMGVLAWRLRCQCTYFISRLRVVELLIFGSSSLLFLVKGHSHILYAASHGYLTPVTPPWIILIFTYALFIPNTWKRALAVIAPLALGPQVTYLTAYLTSSDVVRLIRDTADFHHIFLDATMAMLFVTAIAVGGVRLIRGLRAEVFEAQQLGQYRLKQLLGRGGMGEVYLAEHVMLKRPCAIKIIRPEKAGDPGTLARFEQEVRSTAKLTHWNTVEIFDFGRTEDGTFYYVMEYLPGMSLEQIVDMHGPMTSSRAIHFLVQTCDALEEAHLQGMIHRDIKPANIFAAKRGGKYDVTKLLDFGLVRTMETETDLRLTQDGTVTGSPLYMSPEQASGDAVDARSDIYALGCVGYSLLTGRPPFTEVKPVKLILAHATQPVERPSAIHPGLPLDLENIILRCLEKAREDRFSSVEELRDALLKCEDSQSWTCDDASEWWKGHGCPKKKSIDAAISAGISIAPFPLATQNVHPRELVSTI